MKTKYALTVLVLVALLLPTVAGCRKVTKGNYDKIENGMSLAEVEKILGPGAEQAGAAGTFGEIAGAGKVMSWEDGEQTITVTFVNDKVTAKSSKGL